MMCSIARRGLRGIVGVALAAALGTGTIARAGGTFIGGEVSLSETRGWFVPVNWNLGIPPAPSDALDFTISGDGTVDLAGAPHTHPSVTFDDWVSYSLIDGPGGMTFTGAAPQITVKDSVGATYGSDYFADGTKLDGTVGVSLSGPATTISFAGADSGILRLSGPLSGGAPLTLSRPVATGTGKLYLDSPSGGYSGLVTVGTATAVRLLDSGRTGIGSVSLLGGEFDVLSAVSQSISNSIFSPAGTIFADRNYTAAAVYPFPSSVTHSLGPITVDNPASFGGTGAASLTFKADNLFNFHAPMLTLSNVGLVAVPTRTITVTNGDIRLGYAGSVMQTGPNNLNKALVTTTVDGLTDLAGAVGLKLTKAGGGVLAIGGDNQTSSKGAKDVFEGTLRFLTPISYGTTTGMVGGPAVAVTLKAVGAPAIVSSAMGVGYDTSPPSNLATEGGIPGQSGAFDIDFIGAGAPIPLTKVNAFAVTTALRLGSSGIGSTGGVIAPYAPAGPASAIYYLGGGGGSLLISSPLGTFGGAPMASVEMGTSGSLLPGSVALVGAEMYSGLTFIHAGTLSIPSSGTLPSTGGTSLGAYSTALSTGGTYTGAPATSPYNGPGQLLLSHTAAYSYVPGGSFGATGLTLDGGAIGFDGSLTLAAIPGTYGATLSSTLYGSKAVALAPVATNILHFGGENSSGALTLAFPITNNGTTPVALVKSGILSSLDLTSVPFNVATGGTGILGGEIKVSSPSQLGPGAIVITDGGILHVALGSPTESFGQILRVANGPLGRASQIAVDGGITAAFTSLEADADQSVLEKTGAGALTIYPSAMLPSSDPANTWGVKASGGLLSINQLPGVATDANGFAIFNGGGLTLASPTGPGGITIPTATQYSPKYGFAALASYAGTTSGLLIGDGGFFRINGHNAGNWMGSVVVSMGPTSVFKISGNASGGDTYGTGSMDFEGGNVQFTPVGTQILLPRDGAFTLHLNDGVLFSGTANANLNGNLYFNDAGGSTSVTIDGATVDNSPTAASSTWTIAGTGVTSWKGIVHKGSTQAVPGGTGPFVSGTVEIDRSAGTPVVVIAGSLLGIDAGIVNVGGTGDPFTDNTSGYATPVHVNVANGSGAASGFNITTGAKAIGTLYGSGTTTISAGASLSATYFRQGTLNVSGLGTVRSGSALASILGALSIAGGTTPSGTLDMNDNNMVVHSGDIVTTLAQLKSGLNASGTLWTGTGIKTSTGAADAAANSNATIFAVGAIKNVDKNGALIYSTWPAPPSPDSGVSGLVTTDVLVKYTYFGDADLNGVVDNTTDYDLWSNGFTDPTLAATNGWLYGDFDFSGTVDNTTDYDLWSTGFAHQGGALSAPAAVAGMGVGGPGSVTSATDLQAVPEPSCLMLAILGFGVLRLTRRRR